MHAYLIIAHKNLNQIKVLLSLLDHEKNDIYLHIDKKANKDIINFDFTICCRKSKVFKYNDINVKWGHVSQIKCELFLLKKARLYNKYNYYHLISGMDLPLKDQDFIHDFFNKNKGKQFINFSGKTETAGLSIDDRAKYYWATRWYNLLPIKKSMAIVSRIDYIQVIGQRILRINRLKKSSYNTLYHGSQWFSITDELAKSLIEDESLIIKQFSASYCSDEIFIQSYIMKNKKWFKELYIPKLNNGFDSIKRNIDWLRGGPYVWRKKDYQELIESDFLFARKFDETVDKNIIQMIASNIKTQEKKIG